MKRTALYAAFLIPLSLAMTSIATGQQQVVLGTPAFGSFGGGPLDTVNLGNLNVHFAIPVFHKAGRGMPFLYDLTYDNTVWAPVGSSGSMTWSPSSSNWGWQGLSGAQANQGYISYSTTYSSGTCGQNGQNSWQEWTYNNFVYHDVAGTSHPFNYTTSYVQGNGTQYCPPNGPQPSSPTAVTTTDGSGYIMYATPSSGGASASLVSTSGLGIYPSQTTDANGNEITYNATTGVYTDTLGQTAVTVTGLGTPSSPVKVQYTAPSGATATYQVNFTSTAIKTNFGCSGISEATTTANLVTSITLPDNSSYSFSYEPNGSYYTGRLHQVTLPTGGTITYNYMGANDGVSCTDGSTIGLQRVVNPGGTWTYARTGSGNSWTTTIGDASTPSNQTVINFLKDSASPSTNDFFETQRVVNQGASTPVLTTVTCYNGNVTNCPSPSGGVATPILQVAATRQYPSSGLQSKTSTSYNSYGLVTQVAQYAYASGTPTTVMQTKAISYASLTNGIVDHPSSVTVTDGSSNLLSKTTYAYDGTGVTSSSGTPQHISVTGSRGNMTTVTNYTSSSASLSKQFSYYDTGTVYQATDVNTAVTTYVYGSGSCGNSFPTQINLPLSLSTSTTWNCTGGVSLISTDANGNSTTITYNDPDFWRPAASTDPETNTTFFAYNPSPSYPTLFEVASGLYFNNSVAGDAQYKDAFGRTYVEQKAQSPTSSTGDSVSYTFDANGRPYSTSMPCSVGFSGTCSTPQTTQTYDALNRPLVTTDGGGGTLTDAYNQNDVLQTRGPAPSGENSKKKQMEYDALGRLTSVCEITQGTGYAACSQTNSYNGYLTTYAYGYSSGHTQVTVTQNAQAPSAARQTRTYLYDLIGRLVSETNPENGTTQYVYDTISGTCASYGFPSSPGDLVAKYDANGNDVCSEYDTLHRVVSTYYYGPNTTPSKHFVYDSDAFSGGTMANAKGRLAGAFTCVSGVSTCVGNVLTDEYFSYSVRGEMTDVYEATPHSGSTYYHVTTGYWANGALETLSSNISGVPTQTYGVDGEGRPYSVSASSGQNPVTSTSYSLTTYTDSVTFGSGDSDVFTLDTNTGRMKQYQFNVGSQSDTGNLTWNANGSLGTLAITNQLNSADTQTCNYAHDDLSRIASVGCGSTWSQTFGYDAFGNISKSGSSSFAAGYLLSGGGTTNQIQSLPGVTPTYDADGRLTYDGTHTYGWDAESKMVSVDSTTTTFDALGRMVEKGVSGTYTQIVYSPLGRKYATMNGSTLVKAFVPLPLGSTAVYTSSGLAYYRHKDHLGSSRFASTPSRTMYSSTAYAPYGEPYAQAGTTDLSYTGQDQDTVSGMHDFLDRRYMPVQGRWLSPDPAGLSAVDPRNPQTWNRYAYVMNNPMALLDPLGDDCYDPNGSNDAADDDGSGTCTDSNDPPISPDPVETIQVTAIGFSDSGSPGSSPDPNPGMNCNPGSACWAVLTAQRPTTPYLVAAANNGPTISAAPHLPWYKNPCVTKAIAKGALSTGIDAIGLIPGGGAVSEGFSLFNGAAAVSNGTAILGRVQLGAGIITTANGASDTSALGATQTALGVGGIVLGVAKVTPVAGQIISGISVGLDLVGTGLNIAQCY